MKFGIKGSSDSDESSEEAASAESAEAAVMGPEDYAFIENALGYKFTKSEWLERALTHRSAQARGLKTDYERLEFLGDAVFDLGVAHLLLDRHSEAQEGELSKMRAALVNTTSLAELGREMNLGKYIRLSRGEMASGGAERPSILADVVEAIIGAVYREAGFETALGCIDRLFGDKLQTVTPIDPKTELQELLHATGKAAPEYLLECVEGPEHAPTFITLVQIEKEDIGRGKGPTKKASQQQAAAEALAYLRRKSEADVGD